MIKKLFVPVLISLFLLSLTVVFAQTSSEPEFMEMRISTFDSNNDNLDIITIKEDPSEATYEISPQTDWLRYRWTIRVPEKNVASCDEAVHLVRVKHIVEGETPSIDYPMEGGCVKRDNYFEVHIVDEYDLVDFTQGDTIHKTNRLQVPER